MIVSFHVTTPNLMVLTTTKLVKKHLVYVCLTTTILVKKQLIFVYQTTAKLVKKQYLTLTNLMVPFLFVQVCLTTTNLVMTKVKVMTKAKVMTKVEVMSALSVGTTRRSLHRYGQSWCPPPPPLAPRLARPRTSQWTLLARQGRPPACHWQ